MSPFFISMLRRDLQQRLVFRWALIIEILSTATMLLVFFLIDRYQGHFFGDSLAESMNKLGTSYFGYVSLGLAISALAHAGLGGAPRQLHLERTNRTLEYLMASPLSVHQWAVSSGFCNLVNAFVQFATIFGIAVLILGMKIPHFQIHAACVVVLLSCVPLWCLSVLVLASLLILRRGNPVSFVLSSAFELLGGVYAPQSVLPGWLRGIGEILPITPSVRAMQAIVYRGAGLGDVGADLVQLLALTALYLPIAMLLLAGADRVARRKGTYITY